jgi:hypothetical protein
MFIIGVNFIILKPRCYEWRHETAVGPEARVRRGPYHREPDLEGSLLGSRDGVQFVGVQFEESDSSLGDSKKQDSMSHEAGYINAGSALR